MLLARVLHRSLALLPAFSTSIAYRLEDSTNAYRHDETQGYGVTPDHAKERRRGARSDSGTHVWFTGGNEFREGYWFGFEVLWCMGESISDANAILSDTNGYAQQQKWFQDRISGQLLLDSFLWVLEQLTKIHHDISWEGI